MLTLAHASIITITRSDAGRLRCDNVVVACHPVRQDVINPRRLLGTWSIGLQAERASLPQEISIRSIGNWHRQLRLALKHEAVGEPAREQRIEQATRLSISGRVGTIERAVNHVEVRVAIISGGFPQPLEQPTITLLI